MVRAAQRRVCVRMRPCEWASLRPRAPALCIVSLRLCARALHHLTCCCRGRAEVCGATVLEIACVAELPELRGRERLARRSVFVLAAAVGVAPDPASALARVPSTVALDA